MPSDALSNFAAKMIHGQPLPIDQLAEAIVELERSIPREIDWALQVNGHTDIRPIASPTFPSNWELSTARAAASATPATSTI